MPPKRRKISTGSEDIERDTPIDQSTEQENDVIEECVEIETNNLESLVSSPESKPKNDTLQPTRISKRLIIKRNKLIDEEDPKDKIQAKPARSTTPRKPRASASARHTKQNADGTKGGGQRVWSMADKRAFFLGLQQYGKNFEAISKKISLSAKIRGNPTKDKVQVQYFYYRNWRKIAKFVNMKGTDVPVKTQELYGLINYGVLSKWVSENDPSFEECLNNLIHNGETTFTRKSQRGNRKGRCGKLRTPVCPCLKKINRLIDTTQSVSQKVPQTISIELTPRSSKAWAKVQSVSQNPRLRIKVPSSRTLESVIRFLSKKWKSQRTKNKEKLGVVEESRENLVMFLHPNTKIHPVNLFAQQNEKVNVAFSNYKQNVLPLIQNRKKSQAAKANDKAVAQEKEKEKSSTDVNSEKGNVCSSGEIQGSLQLLSNSNHSQKSEEKLTLFIPENKVQDGNNDPLLVAQKSPSEAPVFFDKILSSTSPISTTKDKKVNSPKTLCPTSVIVEDENAMFPDSSGPFSPSSITSSSSSTLQNPKPHSDHCSSPLMMQHQMSPGHLDITSPASRKKRIGGRNTRKAMTSTDGSLLPVSEPNPAALSVTGNEINSTSSTSPAKQQDCPGPPGSQEKSPHKDSEQEISRLMRLATEEGFTALNSHTVTLLHLSLLLGRETLVRLQYEWRERRPTRGLGCMAGVATIAGGISPLLGQAANQMSNLLRRLCNLATLELTDFVKDTEIKASKTSSSYLCSRCLATTAANTNTTSTSNNTTSSITKGGSSTRTRRQSLLNQTEKQVVEKTQEETDNTKHSAIPATRDISIQTNLPATQLSIPFPGLPASAIHLSQAPGAPGTVRLPGNLQVLQQASVITSGGRTFVATTPTAIGQQVNGTDQIFRVPLIPAFRDAARAEQIKQEQQRRVQEAARNILEQGSNQRKLLKRRRILGKKKREPPVIVQRALMPKVQGEEMVTYVQQPTINAGSNALVYSLNPAEPVVARPVAPYSIPISAKTSRGSSEESPSPHQSSFVIAGQLKSNDILQQAALDAEFNKREDFTTSSSMSGVVISREDRDETKSFGPKPLCEDAAVMNAGESGNIDTSHANKTADENNIAIAGGTLSPQLSMNADISMSDFDISLPGASNMGPDAGDKFLELVFKNSEQGFAGLLSTPKKSTNAGSTLPVLTISTSPVQSTSQDSRILRTPTHFGSAAPAGFITPIKFDLDQAWGTPLAVGDISLSNILDDSLTFTTNAEQKSLNDGPSSLTSSQIDMSSNDDFMKHTEVEDLSFSSLLGDPSFKKDDDSNCGLSPPLSSTSLTAPVPSLMSFSSTGSAAPSAATLGKGSEEEEGRSSAQLFSEVSQDSFITKLDVASSLHGMMVSDSSLDLVSKFEALAGVAANGRGKQPSMTDGVCEDVALAAPLVPLTVKCREEAVEFHTVKLENPSAN